MTYRIYAKSEVAITEDLTYYNPTYKVVVFNVEQANVAMFNFSGTSHVIYAMDESEMRVGRILSFAEANDFYNKTGIFTRR